MDDMRARREAIAQKHMGSAPEEEPMDTEEAPVPEEGGDSAAEVKTEDGYSIAMGEDGVITVTNPEGQSIPVPPDHAMYDDFKAIVEGGGA